MSELTDEQKALLDEITDDQLQDECESRGIWFDESDCMECDDCDECDCDDFKEECQAIWQAFYLGQSDKAVELAKDMVQRVSGRYL